MTDEVQAGAETPAPGTETPAPAPAPAAPPPAAPAAAAAERTRAPNGQYAPKETPPAAPPPATIAAGDRNVQTPPPAPTWRDDWREAMAAAYANPATDKKGYDKELKRLQRFADPSAVYGTARELEGKFTEGGLIKLPGAKATEEEWVAYRKAIGVPEKPEDYAGKLKLANNRVLGENDKPVVEYFAQHMHKANVTPQQMSALTDAYLDYQQQQNEAREEEDAIFHDASMEVLKRDWGGSYERNAGAISTLFANLPAETKDLLLNGRTADGRKLGDHPAVVRTLYAWAMELNPAATLVGGTDSPVQTIDNEIAEIETLMRTDRRAYDKDQAKQARLRELYEARDKFKARANRAA